MIADAGRSLVGFLSNIFGGAKSGGGLGSLLNLGGSVLQGVLRPSGSSGGGIFGGVSSSNSQIMNLGSSNLPQGGFSALAGSNAAMQNLERSLFRQDTLTPPPSLIGSPTGIGAVFNQGAGVVNGSVGQAATQSGKFNFGALGKQFAASVPFLGMSLGGALGGPSRTGGILGSIGGLLAGGSALAGIAALGGIGSGAAAGGLAAFGPLAGLFSNPVTAIVGGALLVGAVILGRKAQRDRDEKARTESWISLKAETLKLIEAVRGDRMDGTDALSRLEEYKTQYRDSVSQLKDKKTREIALAMLTRPEHLPGLEKILRAEIANQKQRQAVEDLLTPTYAKGGVTSGASLIKISKGEKISVPSSVGYKSYQIPGMYDARDDIYAFVPGGTVIQNPKQIREGTINVSESTTRGYAGGGVVGVVASPIASQGQTNISNTKPPVIIVVADEETARVIGNQIPNSVIGRKTIAHVKETGASGLAGEIDKALSGGY
jgi:hypothetical protein